MAKNCETCAHYEYDEDWECYVCNVDLDEDEIVNMKMDMNEKKYPVDKARGNNKKYTEL